MPVKFVKGSGFQEEKKSDGSVKSKTGLAVSEDPFIPIEGVGASVTLRVGYTHNLGNYESLRFDVGCTLPCEEDKEAREKAFDDCMEFCDSKMLELQSHLPVKNGD